MQKLTELEERTYSGFLKYKEQYPQELKLVLACGSNFIEGWFCTDFTEQPKRSIYHLDMTKKFLFDADSISYINIEHGIEHIDFKNGFACLKECFRVLKKGGVLRLSTPSLDKWVQYYTINNDIHERATSIATERWLSEAKDLNIYSKALVFNNAFRNWGHRIIYDFSTLRTMLLKLCFSEVTSVKIGQSSHTALKNLERHAIQSTFKEYNEMELLVIEAKK